MIIVANFLVLAANMFVGYFILWNNIFTPDLSREFQLSSVVPYKG